MEVESLHPHGGLGQNLVQCGLGGPRVGLAVTQLGEPIFRTECVHSVRVLFGREFLAVSQEARVGVGQVHVGSLGRKLLCVYNRENREREMQNR